MEASKSAPALSVRAADRVTFGDYVTEILPLLVKRARLKGVADWDIDDVVQETLLALWAGRERLRGEKCALPWVLGILDHKAHDAIRQKRFESGVRRLSDVHVSYTPEYEELLDRSDSENVRREAARKMDACLLGLPPELLRVVVVMGKMNSFRGAARVIGVSDKTVAARYDRAIRTLMGGEKTQRK